MCSQVLNEKSVCVVYGSVAVRYKKNQHRLHEININWISVFIAIGDSFQSALNVT